MTTFVILFSKKKVIIILRSKNTSTLGNKVYLYSCGCLVGCCQNRTIKMIKGAFFVIFFSAYQGFTLYIIGLFFLLRYLDVCFMIFEMVYNFIDFP